MLWSGSSPLTVVRDGMWGFLLFAGVAWLAVAWSVLRLEPADVADVAGPIVLFAAVTEVVRAFAGTRTWWLNAAMAVLFGATGAVLLLDGGGSWATPAALIGWYLMVRGAADVAISMLTREQDRIWGLLTVVGVVELGLGFFAAGSFARTPELVVLVLAGAALVRGVADLVASLRLREASAVSRAGRLLELSPERAIGVAGYSAGMTDFEEAPSRGARARHRAEPRSSAAGMSDLSAPRPGTGGPGPMSPGAMGPGPISPGAMGPGAMRSGSVGPASVGPGVGGPAAVGPGVSPGGRSGSFHDEVLRTTADLDSMLALAGVTGAAVPGSVARAAAEAEQVEVPDTAEGAEVPRPVSDGSVRQSAEADAASAGAAHAVGRAQVPGGAELPSSAEPHAATTARPQHADEATLPLLDPAARIAKTAMPGMDDTSIIARGRLVD